MHLVQAQRACLLPIIRLCWIRHMRRFAPHTSRLLVPSAARLRFREDRLPWLAFLSLVLLTGHSFIYLPSEAIFGRTLQNSLHITIFAVTASVIWASLRNPRPLVVLTIAAGLAISGESLQALSARHADIGDFALDMLGATAAIIGWTLYARYRFVVGRLPLIVMGILVVILTSAMPLRILVAYHERDMLFPVLLNPTKWAHQALVESNSQVELVSAPGDWTSFADEPVWQVEWSDTRYPEIRIQEPVRDWSDYEHLVVSAYIPEPTPLTCIVAVCHIGKSGTAAHVVHSCPSGASELRVPVSSLIQDERGLPSQISALILHTTNAAAGRRMLIGSVRLE